MRNLTHLIRSLAAAPWAMEPRTLALGQRMLWQAMAGRPFFGVDIHAETGIPMPEERDVENRTEMAKAARIAVVPIYGAIVDHADSLGMSARDIHDRLATAIGAKSVDAVLLDVDSPGGVVSGIPELAETIRVARTKKPMLAWTGGMMASAAYWLGAAAGDVMAAESAMVGSIGVYTIHEDWSGFLENEGIKVTEISAGEFKTEGAPWKALSAEAQAHDQARVDHFYGLFVKSVAGDRRATQTAVREGYGQGRVEIGPVAMKANLVDRLGTFEDAVGRLAKRVAAVQAKGRRAAALRAMELTD